MIRAWDSPPGGLPPKASLDGRVDPSNFFRACKRWFCPTPTQYRQRLAGDRVPC